MIGGAEVKRVIRERCEMSVSPYNNRFYLKKVFRSKFRHEVEISVCQSEECDLVVRETEEGTIRAVYYSKENMERLKQLTECRESMRFAFFETEETGVWQGILLPELKQSKLWKQLDDGSKTEKSSGICTPFLCGVLRWEYRKLIEEEEIYECSRIWEWIACHTYTGRGQRCDAYIILCVWSLTAEIVKVQRRCRKIEAGISGDQCRGQQSFQCCKDTWGTMDVRFHNVEIEEFCNKLTQWERYVLAYLCQDDWEKRLPFGFHFSKFVKDTQALLKEKAFEYYGKDYVKSYFRKDKE